jgi:hypothetical protein
VFDNQIRRFGGSTVISPMHVFAKGYGPAIAPEIAPAYAEDRVWPFDERDACRYSDDGADTCDASLGVAHRSADADPRLSAEEARADRYGLYRVGVLEELDPHDPDEMAAVLAGGDDLWIGFDVNGAWDGAQVARGLIPDYDARSGGGAHAVVLAGYRGSGAARQFLIHNSWGTGWGEGEPQAAARHYEAELRAFFATGGSAAAEMPRETCATACAPSRSLPHGSDISRPGAITTRVHGSFDDARSSVPSGSPPAYGSCHGEGSGAGGGATEGGGGAGLGAADRAAEHATSAPAATRGAERRMRAMAASAAPFDMLPWTARTPEAYGSFPREQCFVPSLEVGSMRGADRSRAATSGGSRASRRPACTSTSRRRTSRRSRAGTSSRRSGCSRSTGTARRRRALRPSTRSCTRSRPTR